MSGSEDLLHGNSSDAYKDLPSQTSEDGYWQTVYELGRGYEEDGDAKRAFTYYEMAASNGNPAAKFKCGKCLYFGKGTERDLIRASGYLQDAEAAGIDGATELLEKANSEIEETGLAEKAAREREELESSGDAEAIYEEARTCYFDKDDIERAIYLLNLPAAREDPDCVHFLGRIYINKYDDPDTGIPYIEKAAYMGHQYACQEMAEYYAQGRYVPEDIETAKEWAEKAASLDEDNVYHACAAIASYYHKKRDYYSALNWLNKVRDEEYGYLNFAGIRRVKEDIVAEHAAKDELRLLRIQKGPLSSEDIRGAFSEFDERARKLYSDKGLSRRILGAQSGNTDDIRCLAYAYFRAGNLDSALEWAEKGAKQNDAECMRLRGDISLFCKDPVEAVGWYQKAASFGSHDAFEDLGYCLTQPYGAVEGVKKDSAKGVGYYEGGALTGSLLCQKELSSMYETGRDVKQDLEKAYHWLNEALLPGDSFKLIDMKAELDKRRDEAKQSADSDPSRKGDDTARSGDTGPSASSTYRPKKDVLFEILGIAASAAFYYLSKLFLANGAGHNAVEKTIHLGFFTGLIVNLVCVGGIVMTAAGALSCLGISLFNEPIIMGIVGGVAGLFYMILLGVHPVLLTYALYISIGLAAVFVLRIIFKKPY